MYNMNHGYLHSNRFLNQHFNILIKSFIQMILLLYLFNLYIYCKHLMLSIYSTKNGSLVEIQPCYKCLPVFLDGIQLLLMYFFYRFHFIILILFLSWPLHHHTYPKQAKSLIFQVFLY